MNVAELVQRPDLGSLIELFVLDLTVIGGTERIYFHNGTNGLNQGIIWQGITYNPFPIQGDGFDKSTKGSLPRPRLSVANVTGIISALCQEWDDLVGAKLTRKRTFARYLDRFNFPGNVNATADPNQSLPDDIYYIDRKVSENLVQVEFELASALDLEGVQLPSREITATVCSWQYRRWNPATNSFDYTGASECSYTGSNYFDVAGNQVTNPALDVCSKAVDSGCKRRFSGALPFGGFPAAKVYKL